MNHVAPSALFTPAHNASQWFVSSTGALRYDLYEGAVRVDDVDMALPFKDELYVAQRVSGVCAAWSARLAGRTVELPGLLYVRERQIITLDGEWDELPFGGVGV